VSKRRGNLEGSIYQRASDGLWAASLSLPNGKRKTIYAKTRPEARDKLRAAQREQERGRDLSVKTQTVAQFLTCWLEDVARPSVRPATFESYSYLVSVHLVPAIGNHKLPSLTPQHVQRLLKDKGAAGLSPRTVTYIRAVLRRALGHALKWGMVSRNVATLVDPPRTERKPVNPLSPKQVRRFLEVTKEEPLGPLFHVALATGLRQGELFGLRWHDVDLDQGTLRVMFALQYQVVIGASETGPRRQPVLVAPKTEKSRRSVFLPASAVAALKAQRTRQLEARLALGQEWRNALDLIFTSPTGAPLHPSNVTHRLHQALAGAGLPRQRFHDLRHGCASLLLTQGVPLKTVQDVLGHSQISLTADTYAHLAPAMKRDAADSLEAILTG
jgi:integrase